MLRNICITLAAAGAANAWLPKHRDMTTHEGVNRFTAPSDSAAAKRWLPGNLPIRGVNLGSYFIMEPWMSSAEWSSVIGCSGSQGSEFDCTNYLGQDTANTNFQKHWGDWITQSDIQTMGSYGLNTIRVPLGYWIFDSLKYDSEHFPSGQLDYLQSVCGWASDQGFYIILDMHGAPFAQVGQNADTGQLAADPTDSNPDFYQSSQYQRGLEFLGNLTQLVHQNGGSSGSMRNVGMIEIVNEPLTTQNDLTQSMRQSFYPDAFSTIRNVENSMGISSNNYLHIEMMNDKWGSGDPTQYLTDNYFAAYDDHRYLCFDGSVTQTRDGYLGATCSDNRGGNTPTIVGEWSLSINSNNQFSSEFWPIQGDILTWYQNWFAAQVQVYERQDGWIFWSWKTSGLNDPRWDYQLAVQAGIIPKDLNSVTSMNPCG